MNSIQFKTDFAGLICPAFLLPKNIGGGLPENHPKRRVPGRKTHRPHKATNASILVFQDSENKGLANPFYLQLGGVGGQHKNRNAPSTKTFL